MDTRVRNELEAQSSHAADQLSEVVCWSRMQTEAGQALKDIVLRKEVERKAGLGRFCWGIGNAPGRSIPFYCRSRLRIDVVFSIMKSRPKFVDVAPSDIFVWRSFVDMDRRVRALPRHVLVTSRGTASKRAHYALMCYSQSPLVIGDFGPFDPAAYRNVSTAESPVGASQVTALLRRVAPEALQSSYRVNLRACLVDSYWVRLADPALATQSKVDALTQSLSVQGRMVGEDDEVPRLL
jgi:hypothetical protein